MSDQAKRIRASYLNGLAVAVISLAASAVISGASWWILLVATGASAALHAAAVRAGR